MGNKIEIMISCCLCSEKYTTEIDAPIGWECMESIEEEGRSFCPKHAGIAEWKYAQCPGCVGGWGDCSLWKSFAYSYEKDQLTKRDLEIIESGFCPHRTNGSFTVMNEPDKFEMKSMDMSNKAPADSGAILVQAIRDYWEKYRGR